MFCNCFFPTVGCRWFFSWQRWVKSLEVASMEHVAVEMGSFPASYASKRKCWRFPEGYCLQFHSCWIHCTSSFSFFSWICWRWFDMLGLFSQWELHPLGNRTGYWGHPLSKSQCSTFEPRLFQLLLTIRHCETLGNWEYQQSMKVCGDYYGLFTWNMLD